MRWKGSIASLNPRKLKKIKYSNSLKWRFLSIFSVNLKNRRKIIFKMFTGIFWQRKLLLGYVLVIIKGKKNSHGQGMFRKNMNWTKNWTESANIALWKKNMFKKTRKKKKLIVKHKRLNASFISPFNRKLMACWWRLTPRKMARSTNPEI